MTGDTSVAVLDRIVDDETAVLLIERDDDQLEQVTLSVELIPQEGAFEGAVFELTVSDDIFHLEYDEDTYTSRRDRIRKRFDDLSERL